MPSIPNMIRIAAPPRRKALDFLFAFDMANKPLIKPTKLAINIIPAMKRRV